MFIFIALLVLLFGLNAQNGETVQVLGVLIFILAGCIAVLKAQGGRRYFELDGATLLICFLLPIVSIVVLYFGQRFELIPQTLAFMLCGLSARALISVYGIEKIIRTFVYASCALTFVTLIFEFDLLWNSLSFAVDDIGARIRFTPFNNHPNLTGHIFGIALICCSVYGYWYKQHRKIIWYMAVIASVACAIIIAAASSRGAIVATILGLASIYLAHLLQSKYKERVLVKNVVIGLFALLILMLVNADSIVGYISELFELNSDYRGLNSGLTGRSDNWPVIIGLSLETFNGGVFGHGIRSWNDALYGIATDSSYVNSLWESGILLTISVIVLLLKKIQLFGSVDRSFRSDLYLALLIFVAVESIVARYLLGIGNPASLIILIVLLTPEQLVCTIRKKSASIVNKNNRRVGRHYAAK